MSPGMGIIAVSSLLYYKILKTIYDCPIICLEFAFHIFICHNNSDVLSIYAFEWPVVPNLWNSSALRKIDTFEVCTFPKDLTFNRCYCSQSYIFKCITITCLECTERYYRNIGFIQIHPAQIGRMTKSIKSYGFQ